MKKKILLSVLLLNFIFVSFVYSDTNLKVKSRNSKWAKKIDSDSLILPNFHKVSDILYRGAQPTAAGIKKLKKMGIKTIINLRAFHSDRKKIGNTALNYKHIFIKTWHFEEEDAVKFLNIVSDTMLTPVFVHCQHGSDRTGTMCALYRIVFENWSKKDAIDEMIYGGFGYHKIWKNLIKFLKEIDIQHLKKQIKNYKKISVKTGKK